MSQSGELKLFTSAGSENPCSVLKALLDWSGVETLLASRFVEYEDEFGSLDVDLQVLGQKVQREVPELYEEGATLLLDCGAAAAGQRMSLAIQSEIEPAIRGSFCPACLVLYCGTHSIVDDTCDPEILVARPFVTVGFFGYSTPLDWGRMRAAVFQVPEVQAIKCDLEALLGHLDEVALWSV